ncbi:hypothetical protein CEXT_163741 [Caerostris extrusa]|uniref:Transmembrane protein n=1 Tax=Caerostris extrusa TaxID=172846 RepID=A0AAV4SJX5_CAEEX|nr:hypothetical protein CEXT_163741 [Caerostris extrusa]
MRTTRKDRTPWRMLPLFYILKRGCLVWFMIGNGLFFIVCAASVRAFTLIMRHERSLTYRGRPVDPFPSPPLSPGKKLVHPLSRNFLFCSFVLAKPCLFFFFSSLGMRLGRVENVLMEWEGGR